MLPIQWAGKKAGLRRVRVGTEVPKVQIVTAGNIWVPAAVQAVQPAK